MVNIMEMVKVRNLEAYATHEIENLPKRIEEVDSFNACFIGRYPWDTQKYLTPDTDLININGLLYKPHYEAEMVEKISKSGKKTRKMKSVLKYFDRVELVK